LPADFGVGLIIGHDDLGGTASEFAAVELDGELKTIADVYAQAGSRTRQGAEQADTDGLCGLGRRATYSGSQRSDQGQTNRDKTGQVHCRLP
jgi:hypothetical protein